ncbi:MAG: gas vesicle protein GvpD [Candidatus Diapherotrites archaeon]|nr:gas vesicle protein GvpD [Candidatus Diapherotrites archaeon]
MNKGAKMNRVATGIKGLDELMEGGFPENRSVLITGGCGTGKTILSMQFLYNGATKFKEPGLYVTLDERPELIREDVKRFGWDVAKLEEKKMLTILDGTIIMRTFEGKKISPEEKIEQLINEIIRETKKIKAKRLVIDSLPAIGFQYSEKAEVRKAILKLAFMLDRTGLTSILTSEINEGSNSYGKFGVEEFVADGVIVLHYMGIGTQSNRTLHIRKMRSTKHSEDLHPIKITDKGIEIHSLSEEYEKT